MTRRDLTGQSFGKLTVMDRWQSIGKQKRKYICWLCMCSCGNTTWVPSRHLTRGHTTSCGCFRREILSRNGRESLRHGHAGKESRTYRSWHTMWNRTTNRKVNSAHRYVKRGITVVPRWKSFEAFLADMGERPPGTSLHRVNNNLGYSPENCKWATPFEQARNRCNTKLTFNTAVQIALRAFRGERHSIIANDFAVSRRMVGNIVAGRTWRDALLKAASAFQ